ncbi:MAG: hypothetical protein ACXVF0_02385 [Blastococcus sp.]
MTRTTGSLNGLRPDDPFIRQVLWLVDAAGGRDQLARASGNRVSARTLDNWIRGQYPRSAVTGAVRELDAWALQNVPGYPDGAGAPRLIATCGPTARSGTVEPSAAPETAPQKRGWAKRAWTLAAAAVVAAAAIAVTTGFLLHGTGAANPLAPLPSTGDGTLYPEKTGHIGANTFADPRTLLDNAQPIPKDTTVQVRCRYYAPSIPSVTPDGFWYLIDSGDWAGRWSPANSFMNGDLPGARTVHNTDFAVPLCR